jgi:mannose-6-phosphate isomerase-like protein (cupin superfamily)
VPGRPGRLAGAVSARTAGIVAGVSEGWTAVSVDAVEAVPWQDTDLVWRPLRHALGTHVAGLAAFTADAAGQTVVEPHRESAGGRGHEEVYVVLRGRAAFTLDGEALDAPAGTLVRVAPDVHRHAVAAEPGTAVLALGDDPDFRPSASEWLERARPFLRSDPQRARAILADLHAQRSGSPGDRLGQALLAAAGGDDDAARAALASVLAEHPEYRVPLSADPDLGRYV